MKTVYNIGDLVYLRAFIPDEWREQSSDWLLPESLERLGRGPFKVLGDSAGRYLQIDVSSVSRELSALVRPEEVLPYEKPVLEEEAEWE